MSIPYDYGDREYPQAQKEQWHRERENVFTRKLVEAKGDAQRVMVICGFVHFTPMIENLGMVSKVAAVDYRQMNWYNAVFPE